MRPLAALLCLLAGLTGGLPAAAQQTAAGGTVRVGQPNAARFPQVSLYLDARDARGGYTAGLGAGQFRVLEDGRPAQIVEIDARGGALDVCLALDSSRSMLADNKIEFAKAAAREFVTQLGPDDQAALLTFGEGTTLDQALTRDRALLRAAVDRTQAVGNTTTFMDGVYWAVTQVALRSHGGSVVSAGPARADARRVVVALTDGVDLSSRVLPQELIDYARSNGVSLCMVALGRDAALYQMQSLAQQTGGVYLEAPQPQQLRQLYGELARQLRREYRLVVRSPRPEPDGTRRKVQVEVLPLAAQADTWYQAPGRGSLVVTVPAATGQQGPGVAGAGGSGPAQPGIGKQFAVGLLMIAVGLTAVLVAGVVWWTTRRGPLLQIRDSNPRIDLLPLWVNQGDTRVGRGAECEVVLDSREVSRVHARIEALAGHYRLIDEGSRNGTYVNGRRVRGTQELRIGDVIRFGDREFRFAGELVGS